MTKVTNILCHIGSSGSFDQALVVTASTVSIIQKHRTKDRSRKKSVPVITGFYLKRSPPRDLRRPASAHPRHKIITSPTPPPPSTSTISVSEKISLVNVDLNLLLTRPN